MRGFRNHARSSGEGQNMYAKGAERDPTFESYLRYGIAVSLLLHVLFVYMLVSHRMPIHAAPRVINVVLEPPFRDALSLNRTQIVSPSESPEVKVAPDTRFKSDKNRRTETEQVKRGDGLMSRR